jgi:hypothetical protein
MNRLRGSAVGLNPRGQVAAMLLCFGGIESPILIPQDQDALDAAVLTGRTLRDASPKSPARLSIRRFVLDELIVAAAENAERAPLRLRRRARKTVPAL